MAWNIAALFGISKKPPVPKKLVIHTNRCPQNHKCPSVQACPTGALKQKGYKVPTVDRNLCTNCGRCSRSCMPGALRMEKLSV
nr:4Fe-4S ferredoxin [uncultured Sphaerochaeta sp.]